MSQEEKTFTCTQCNQSRPIKGAQIFCIKHLDVVHACEDCKLPLVQDLEPTKHGLKFKILNTRTDLSKYFQSMRKLYEHLGKLGNGDYFDTIVEVDAFGSKTTYNLPLFDLEIRQLLLHRGHKYWKPAAGFIEAKIEKQVSLLEKEKKDLKRRHGIIIDSYRKIIKNAETRKMIRQLDEEGRLVKRQK